MARLLLALAWACAGASKLIADEAGPDVWLAPWQMHALAAIEFLVAIALLTRPFYRVAAIISLVLAALFVVVHVAAAIFGWSGRCGCMGTNLEASRTVPMTLALGMCLLSWARLSQRDNGPTSP